MPDGPREFDPEAQREVKRAQLQKEYDDAVEEVIERRLAIKPDTWTLHVVGTRGDRLAFVDELTELKLELSGTGPVLTAQLREGGGSPPAAGESSR